MAKVVGLAQPFKPPLRAPTKGGFAVHGQRDVHQYPAGAVVAKHEIIIGSGVNRARNSLTQFAHASLVNSLIAGEKRKRYDANMVDKEIIEMSADSLRQLITGGRLERRASGCWVAIIDCVGELQIDGYRKAAFNSEIRIRGSQKGTKPRGKQSVNKAGKFRTIKKGVVRK